MAAERAPTMATTIQSSFRHSPARAVAALAKSQQRAGERERQGEHGMLELDHFERQAQAFAASCGKLPTILLRRSTLTALAPKY